MPKKNFDVVLRQLDGSPITRGGDPVVNSDGTIAKNPDGTAILNPKRELFARTAIAEALLGQDTKDADEKLRFGLLAFKIAGGKGEQDFKSDEVADMKKAVGKAWGPLLVCQIVPMLDK